MFKPDSRRGPLRVLMGVLACVLLSPVAISAHAQSAKELQLFESFLGIMHSYLELIEMTHDVNADDSRAAVLQLQKMKEIFDEQGDVDGAVEFFGALLETADNRTVRNTTYMLLVDLLKDAGRFDDAEALMRDALEESMTALGD